MNYKFVNLFLNFFILIIIFIFINTHSSFSNNHEEEDFGPLDEQSSNLINDFQRSISEMKLANSELSTNIDIILENLLDLVTFIDQSIKDNDLESAALALDFIINTISEVNSNLPTETKLDLSDIKFEDINEEKKEIIVDILTDINSKKINLLKDTIYYGTKLKEKNIDVFTIISNVNNSSLGFEQLNEEITGVKLDLSIVDTLDFNELESALKSLEQIDIEKMTSEIEDSIKESTQLIEQVVQDVAEAVAVTASQVMDEINSYLGTNMTVEVYAWLIGVDGVTGSMSFADAVNLFNEQYGTDLTEAEAANEVAYDICWLYGLCQ